MFANTLQFFRDNVAVAKLHRKLQKLRQYKNEVRPSDFKAIQRSIGIWNIAMSEWCYEAETHFPKQCQHSRNETDIEKSCVNNLDTVAENLLLVKLKIRDYKASKE